MDRSPEIERNDEENAGSTVVESTDDAAPAPQRPSIARKDIADMVDDPKIIAFAHKVGAPKTKFIVLRISAIKRTCRLRALNKEKLPDMAQRFEENTILHPPAVWFSGQAGWVLVTGAHRVEAALLNGSTHMVFRVFEGTADQVARAEIDENLNRIPPSAAEEADMIRLYRELWEKEYLNTGQQLPGNKGGRGKKGFASALAKATGKSKRAAAMAILRSELDQSVLDAVQGTTLNCKTFLNMLTSIGLCRGVNGETTPAEKQLRYIAYFKGLSEEQQKSAIQKAREGDAQSGKYRGIKGMMRYANRGPAVDNARDRYVRELKKIPWECRVLSLRAAVAACDIALAELIEEPEPEEVAS